MMDETKRLAIEQLERVSKNLGAIGETVDYTELAIEALEKEPCEDCIGREETKQFLYERIDRLNDDELYDIFSKIIDDMYNELLPVTSQPKWIPVSERLPKIAGVYRVTRYYPNNVMNPSYIVDACAFDGSNTWYDDNRINLERAYADNVIAWQEDPEPYTPQEVEREE